MARRADKPRGCRPRGKEGIYQLRYLYKGYLLEESTGTADAGEAGRIAEDMRVEWRKYVDSGEAADVADAQARARTSFKEVAQAWLATKKHVRPSTYEGWEWKVTMLTREIGAESIEDIDKAAVQAFITKRMGQVQRDTVMDDLELLRNILLTALPEDRLPEWKNPNKEETGAVHRRARGEGIAVEPAEAYAILKLVPERGRNNRFPQRAWCQLLFETGLRPYEAARLERGKHWDLGGDILFLPAADTKIKEPREVPLNRKARAALTVLHRWSAKHHPNDPRIAPAFNRRGVPDVRKPLGHAALKVLGPGRAAVFHSQCFRVSYITREARRPDVALAEISYMVGQRNSYTQDRYNKTGSKHVRDYWARRTGS